MQSLQVLISANEIGFRIGQMAAQIRQAKLNNLVVVPILNGAFMFAADLLRALHRNKVETTTDFLSLSSYGAGVTSLGRIEVRRDLTTDVAGRDVLLVDDILDTGRTLNFAADYMAARGAARVMSAVLLDKPARRAINIKPDFTGFGVGNHFVVGYGLDLDGQYRDQPWIGHLEQEPARPIVPTHGEAVA